MALARSVTLTSAANSTDATSVTTASITPTANALQLCFVVNTKASAPDAPSSVVRSAISWVQVATATQGAYRVTCFRNMEASPAAGAVVITWPATQTGRGYLLEEWTGVDTTGTQGSGAIVENPTAVNASIQTLTITYAAAVAAGNGCSSGFVTNITGAVTPKTGWTQAIDSGFEAPTCEFETQYLVAGSGQTTSTCASAGDPQLFAGVAVVIKAASGGTPVSSDFIAPYSAETAIPVSVLSNYSALQSIGLNSLVDYSASSPAFSDAVTSYHAESGLSSADVVASYSSLAATINNFIVDYFSSGPVLSDAVINYDSMSRTLADIIFSFAAEQGVLNTAVTDYSALQAVLSNVLTDYEATSSVSSTALFNLSALQSISADSTVNQEALSLLLSSLIGNYEALGGTVTPVENSYIINYNALSAVLGDMVANYNSSATLAKDTVHDVESLKAINGVVPWFSDTFDGANQSLDASNGWVERNGGYSRTGNSAILDINIASGAVVAHNPAGIISANYSVRSPCRYPTGSGVEWVGVGGRRVNFGVSDSNLYAAMLNRGSTSIFLYKRLSGAWAQLGTFLFATINLDVIYDVHLIMNDTTISVEVDGVQRISVVDASLSAQGDACLCNGSGGVGTGYEWLSFTVDAIGGTTQTPNNITVPYCADIGVSSSPVLSYTALMAISRDTLFDYDATSPIQTTMIISYDAAQSIEALSSASYEALLGVLTNVIVNIEALNGVATTPVSNDFIISVTAEGSIIVTFLPVYSANQTVSVATLTDYETKSTALSDVTISDESLAALSNSATFSDESAAAILNSFTVDGEAVARVFNSAIVSNEAAQSITLNAVENYESVSLIFVDKILNFESLGVIEIPVSKDFIIAMESLGTAINAMTIDFSSVSNVQISSALSFEAKATIELSKTGDYESLSSVAAIGSLPFEVLQAISFLTNVPYEALLGSNVVVVFNLVAKTASFTLSLNRSISVKKSVTGTLTFKNKVDKTSGFH